MKTDNLHDALNRWLSRHPLVVCLILLGVGLGLLTLGDGILRQAHGVFLIILSVAWFFINRAKENSNV